MSRKRITEVLSSGRILVSDGAWGTVMQKHGLGPGDCPEIWCIDKSDLVFTIAKDYAEAGSDLVETNSFGGNPIKLEHYGLAERTEELNRKAAELTRKAVGEDKWVMGSMGPTGKMLFMGEVTEEDLYEAFKRQALALAEGGADAVIVETFSATDEAAIAIRAVRENTSLEVIGSFTFEQTVSGEFRTMMGVTPTQAIEAALEAGAHITGINCGNGYEGLEKVVGEYKRVSPKTPVLLQPNAGVPKTVDGEDVFQATPQEMGEQVKLWIEAGANIIGGCCGTTPEHIRAIRNAVDAYK